MKILLADDDIIARTMVNATLKRAGYEAEHVTDGKAALAALRIESGPRIAILDWMMPGMSGLEVCQAIRNNPGKGYIYIILLSGKSESDEVVSGLDAGADDYIIKPFEQHRFLARIRVAERVLKVHQVLIDTIAEQEILLRRHNLLGDVLHKQMLPAERTQIVPSPFYTEPEPTHFSSKTQNFKTLTEVDQLFARVIAQMGISPLTSKDPESAAAPQEMDLVGCTSVYIPNSGVWLDIVLEMDQPSALAMGLAVLGTLDVCDKDVLDLLGEILSLFQRSLKAKGTHGGSDVMAPFVPKARLRSEFTDLPKHGENYGRWLLSHPSIDFRVTISETSSAVVSKKCAALQLLDVVAEQVMMPDKPGALCVEKGAVLNDFNIRKILQASRTAPKDWSIKVVGPSLLARALCKR